MTHEASWDARATVPLIKTLESRDPDLRRSAAFALGNIRDKRVIEPLTKAVRDADPEVRRWAMLGLGRNADPASIPVLVNCLRETGQAERRAAVEALAMVGAPAIPALVGALGHFNIEAGCAAAGVLGRVADVRAVEPLIHALRSPEPALRMAAARALAESAANDPLPEVRMALAPLRRLAWQEQGAFYREVIARIEGATAPTAHLPIPADQPAPSVAHLPIPAHPGASASEELPIPAAVPPEGPAETGFVAPGGLRRLRLLFSRWFRGRP